VTTTRFPLEQLPLAMSTLLNRQVQGKVIITMGGDGRGAAAAAADGGGAQQGSGSSSGSDAAASSSQRARL
jgi:hypothetical protein